jgi:hypothetical protein
MADNIMGPEVNLGLNVNLELDRSAQDAATLADQIRQMRVDQEAFRDIVADTQDRLREITGSYQEQLALRQQLLSVEESLRNISESRTDSLRDQVNAYRDMEQSVSRMGQGQSVPMQDFNGMSGMGNMMGGFFNPMMGMMMNMGGFPSAFSGTPADENAMAENMMMQQEDKEGTGLFDKVRKFANDFFFISQLPDELDKMFGGGGHPGGKQSSGGATQNINADTVYMTIDKVDVQNVNVGGGGGGGGGIDNALPGGLGDSGDSGGSSLGGAAGQIMSKLRGTFIGRTLLKYAPQVVGLLAENADVVGGITAAYKVGANIAQTGQEYGTLTGTDSYVGGYGAKMQSMLGSYFGLNPLMPSGVSSEIESMGLASGYQYGSNYLNQYRSFASGAYERFGLSPQEAQQMFQNAVVQAGGSADLLGKSLEQLGQQAANSGVAFSQMTQGFAQGLAQYAGTGLTGNNVMQAALATVGEFTGGTQQQNQILQGVGANTINPFFGGMVGQALLANQMGTGLGGLFGSQMQMGSLGGYQTGANELAVVKNILSGFGMSAGHTWKNVAPAFFALQQMGFNFGSEKQLSAFAGEIFNTPGDFGKGAAATLRKPELSDYLTGYRISAQGVATGEAKYETALKKYNEKEAAIKKLYGNKIGTNSDPMSMLQKAMGSNQSGSSVNAGGVQITLSPKAQKLGLTLQMSSAEYGMSAANSVYGYPIA